MPDDTSVADANRLYWESDLAVSVIADRLDVSRRALYDAIRPLPAGNCPACNGALGYANRMARDGGAATCERCGAETDADSAAAATSAAVAPSGGAAKPDVSARAAGHTAGSPRRGSTSAPLLHGRSAGILAAAAGGALAGTLGVLLLRRLR